MQQSKPPNSYNEYSGDAMFEARREMRKRSACRINKTAIAASKARVAFEKKTIFSVLYESVNAVTPEEKLIALKDKIIDKNVIVSGAASIDEELAAVEDYALSTLGL